MYLLEHFSRLKADGKEDTVSVFMSSVDEDRLSPQAKEQLASFLRMAATFAKQAAMLNRADYLELGCLALNQAMEACGRVGPPKPEA
jgi:hypothetical protein